MFQASSLSVFFKLSTENIPTGFVRIMVGWYLQVVDPILANVWKVSSKKSTHDLLKWEVEKDAWVHEFHEKV